MEKNNLYFLKMWLRTLIIVIPIICLLLFGVFKDMANSIDIILVFVVITGAIIYNSKNKTNNFMRNRVNNSVDKGFQNETSEQLLDFYDSTLKSNPIISKDRDAMLAYCKSVICCYYGESDKVLQMLSEIDWNSRTPYIQSLEISIKALLSYLQYNDYKEGLRLSIIAQRLGNISVKIPGGNKTSSFYETYVEVGELLNGNIKTDIIESLEAKFNESTILIRILIAYCLSKVYIQINMTKKAEEKIQYCRQMAPYCKLLFN